MDINTFPEAQWRLLETGYADGATNMAVDEAILVAVAEGKAPPTIRFYGWDPPCLSIGYNQSMQEEVDIGRCRAEGVDFVRRPTGGRAILHADELTYSLVAPQSDPRVKGGVLESYRRLSLGLVRGLNLLGVEATQAGRHSNNECASAACFEAPSDYEVVWRGKKLVGSAQLRRRGAVLQHGSLPLYGDVSRIVEFLLLPSLREREQLRESLRRRAATLEEALGRVVSFEEAARALKRGFEESLNLKLVPSVLTPYERELAEKLREKYASEEWNLRH